MKTSRAKRYRLPVMAFCTPVLLYLLVMALAKIVPFGDHTLLLWDANYQNTAFLSYWKHVLTGQADGLYSFSRTLGGNMIGMIAFYLASPLNLLVLLPIRLPLLYSLLVLLKIGLCGFTFMLFLRKRAWSSLLFSTTYALSGFIAAYCYRIAWIDAMILLPLVALGILQIHEGKKPILYTLSLGAALASQYYFGYMLCLFAILYFLYRMPAWQWKTVAWFAGASLLAAGLAAVVLVPNLFSLEDGYSLFSSGLLTLNRVNAPEHLLTNFYTAAVSVVQLRGNSPNFYVGIPVLVFVALYLANGTVPLQQRLRTLAFLLLFVVSFWIAAPYYIWQAFDAPNFYPARFSFLFSFLLIETGFAGYHAMRQPKKRLLVIAGGCIVISYLLFHRLTVEYLAYKTILMDVAACILTCLLLLPKKGRTAAIWLIVLMQFAGLFFNSYYAYRRLSAVYTAQDSTYMQEVETIQQQIDRVQAMDNSLYRMEKDFHRNDNDPLLYDYRGISHMSSDLDQVFMVFCMQTGLYQGNYHLAYRSGTTPVLESLLGVKYILRKEGVAFAPLPQGYTKLWRAGDVTAYENGYALPFAYLVEPQTQALTDENPFVNQNIMLSDMTGKPVTVFEPVTEITRTFDGTWETYTFPVQANRALYMHSFGTEYTFNGEAISGTRLNGSVLLPPAAQDTTYTLGMTAPLGIALAYFDLAAFQKAQAVLAAHTAQAESDTDSHMVITANVTDTFTQLLITVPYDKGWQVWVDGAKAETVSRYNALLAVNLSQGEHTVELRFVPQGLITGTAISTFCLLGLLCWTIVMRKRKKR